MEDTTPLPPVIVATAFTKADWFTAVGMGLTFLMAVGCMTANFFKPGSVPSEPIWAFGTVVLGKHISSDWLRAQQ